MKKPRAKSGAHVGMDACRNDKRYPRVSHAVDTLLIKGFVAKRTHDGTIEEECAWRESR